MLRIEETGEVFYTDTEKLYAHPLRKGDISINQSAAGDLMDIAEELDRLALQLFKLGSSEGVDDKLGGNLESKAELLNQMSMDIFRHID